MMCRRCCWPAGGSMLSWRSVLRARLQQSSLRACRPVPAQPKEELSKSGHGRPLPCRGGYGSRASRGRGQLKCSNGQRQKGQQSSEQRRRQPSRRSSFCRRRPTSCQARRRPWQRCLQMHPRPRASTICGRRGPGPCQGRCRRSTAVCRDPGYVCGAAARPETPPGSRTWPGSRAVRRSGRRRQPAMPWCRTLQVGSAPGACSPPGRSTQPKPRDSGAPYQCSAGRGPPGRRARPACVRSSAGSGLSGISVARRSPRSSRTSSLSRSI